MLLAEHFIHYQTLHSPRMTAGDVLRKLRALFLEVGVLTEKWFHELFHMYMSVGRLKDATTPVAHSCHFRRGMVCRA